MFAIALLPGAAGRAPYAAVEVDPFAPAPHVTFPADYQSALVDDIARELSVEFPTVLILRQGDPSPGQPVLRISGTVVEFKPGDRTKKLLLGFGAGAAVVRAQVSFSDAGEGKTLAARHLQGAWSGDSQGTSDSLSKRIVKMCNTAHLVGSN